MSESRAAVAPADLRSGTAIRARFPVDSALGGVPDFDTLSDTLRSGRGCDFWTWLDPEFENSLGKTPIWTPPDAAGQATSGFVISRSAVRVRSPAPALLLYCQTFTGARRARPPVAASRVGCI